MSNILIVVPHYNKSEDTWGIANISTTLYITIEDERTVKFHYPEGKFIKAVFEHPHEAKEYLSRVKQLLISEV